MLKKITGEYAFFRKQPDSMRTLLITNMLFALILPIIEIFVAAYVMRNTGSSSSVVVYQLFMYIGIICTSMINGYLLKVMKAKILYMSGILISGISLMAMMFTGNLTFFDLCIAGFSLGAATGFFWTNRYLLTLNATNDENRNYFFGLESFFFSIWGIVVPLAVGALLVFISTNRIFGLTLNIKGGYQIITIVVMVIAMIASYVIYNGDFKNPEKKDFVYFKYHKQWNLMLLLAALKGMVQGFLVTAPAILVMKLVGSEGSLGLIQGIGGAVTALIVYILGRISTPKHRIFIFGFGLIIFFLGTLFNGILFSALGVIVFVLCKVLFQPLFDLAYYPVMLQTIDVVSRIEKRNEYAYIMSHEAGLFFGRASGMILFIGMASLITEDFALKYALVIVAGIQLIAMPLANLIIRRNSLLEQSIK